MEIANAVLYDEAATAALGAALAPVIAVGDIIRLEGDLGAGKSTLARALIASLSGVDEAPSPTFPMVETYEASGFQLWHFDLYRLDTPDEVWELGLEEALDGGTLLIEWPDRIDSLLPAQALTIRLEIIGDGRRAIILGDERWRERLHKAGIA